MLMNENHLQYDESLDQAVSYTQIGMPLILPIFDFVDACMGMFNEIASTEYVRYQL